MLGKFYKIVSEKKGKIYKIVSQNTDKIYIGSTFQNINTRLSTHKSSYKRYTNNISRCYYTAFDVLKHGDVSIVEIDTANNKKDLHKKEKEYIFMNIHICTNKNMPSRTIREYQQTEKFKQYSSQYYKNYNLNKKLNK